MCQSIDQKIELADIIITTRCNAKCHFCAYWQIPPKDINLTTFESLINFLSNDGLKTILLTGGEPLLHPNFKDFLKIIQEKSLLTAINTNGWHLNCLGTLELENIKSIDISLDSSDENNYQQVRGRPMLPNVIKNIERMVNLSKNTRITISFLIQKENFKYLPAVYQLTEKLKVSNLSLLVPYKTKNSFGWDKTDICQPNISYLNKTEIEELALIFEQIQIKEKSGKHLIKQSESIFTEYIEYFKMLANLPFNLPERHCLIPNKTITITEDTTVKPCFYLPHEFTWNQHNSPNELLATFRKDFCRQYQQCEFCLQCISNDSIRPKKNN